MPKVEVELPGEVIEFLDKVVATSEYQGREEVIRELVGELEKVFPDSGGTGSPADTGGEVSVDGDRGGNVTIQMRFPVKPRPPEND